MADEKKLTTRAQDFQRVVQRSGVRAELADYSRARLLVIRPNGYGIWERMQRRSTTMFKATGHQNAYFPPVHPRELLQKEKDHVEGFAPQLAVVTHGGAKKAG